MQGAQDSRKGWPGILALGQELWGGKIGWSMLSLYQLLPRPGHLRLLVVAGGGVRPTSPSPLSPWLSLGTVPGLQMHATEFSRLLDLGAWALGLCLAVLASSPVSWPESCSSSQAQLQPPSFIREVLILWPSQLSCLGFCPLGELANWVSHLPTRP